MNGNSSGEAPIKLDPALVEATPTMLVKYEKDLERVKGALDKVLADLN